MTRRSRTAVLCVHGIGNQRAEETVRGIVNAVWFDDDNHPTGSERSRIEQSLAVRAKPGSSSAQKKRVWTHPETGGDDIDLLVMTTSEVEESSDKRSVDFHELYWAYLMSETRAVAVLLWLFELVRKGPVLKPAINGLWWVGAIFMWIIVISGSLLGIRAVILFIQVSDNPFITFSTISRNLGR